MAIRKTATQSNRVLSSFHLDFFQHRDRWHSLLASRSATGVLHFADVDGVAKPRTLKFRIETTEQGWTGLYLSGLGLEQAIDVRRISRRGNLLTRFFCSRCQKVRHGCLDYFSGGSIRKFLCKDCPEHESNWQTWLAVPRPTWRPGDPVSLWNKMVKTAWRKGGPSYYISKIVVN